MGKDTDKLYTLWGLMSEIYKELNSKARKQITLLKMGKIPE